MEDYLGRNSVDKMESPKIIDEVNTFRIKPLIVYTTLLLHLKNVEKI